MLYTLNYHKEAINPFKDYLIENGDNVDVLIMLGDIYFTQSRYGESIEIYNQLLIEFPE